MDRSVRDFHARAMSVRVLRHSSVPVPIAGPAITSDSARTPRFWATVYQVSRLSGLRDNSVVPQLHAVDAFYRFVEASEGADVLDALLSALDANRLGQHLESFFNAERNRSLVEGSDLGPRWASVRSFVFFTIEALTVTSADVAIVGSMKSVLSRWETLFKNLSPSPRCPRAHVLRALPAGVISEVYDLFNPVSPRNPFKSEMQRRRNYCIMLLLLHQGLRRGEVLLLPVNAIKSGRDENNLALRHWINVVNEFKVEDPRMSGRPSIKNAQSVRQVPVASDLVAILENFTANYRGRSPYPHLLLNSRREPLGTRGLSKVFEQASKHLSAGGQQALMDNMRPPTLAPHDFRHTCAVIRLAHLRAAGIAEEEALQKLRAFFGWTYDSAMPRLYARAYWERHVQDVWHENFDAHVSALRELEHSIE